MHLLWLLLTLTLQILLSTLLLAFLGEQADPSTAHPSCGFAPSSDEPSQHVRRALDATSLPFHS